MVFNYHINPNTYFKKSYMPWFFTASDEPIESEIQYSIFRAQEILQQVGQTAPPNAPNPTVTIWHNKEQYDPIIVGAPPGVSTEAPVLVLAWNIELLSLTLPYWLNADNSQTFVRLANPQTP
jgi:hypothetical protein